MSDSEAQRMLPGQIQQDERRDAAARWYARVSGGSLGAADSAAFEAWLAADIDNRRAYDEQRVLWAQLELPARRLAQRHPPLPSRRNRLWARSGMAASLAAALALIWLVNPNLVQNMRADLVSGTEAVQLVELPDGSTLWVGADSALAFDFTPERRHVRLLRGAAFFDVVPGSTPAFTIDAGQGDVRVIGTRFGVERLGSELVVQVEEGRVEVRGARDAAPVALAPEAMLRVVAGAAGPVMPADLETGLAWMQGRVEVQQVPVGQLVEVIARHLPGRVLVRGWVTDQRISGSFPLDDPMGSLQTIAAATGARLLQGSDWVTLLY